MTAPSASEKSFDLLIIGLGPAGVSCALQARRDGLDIVVVGDEPVGGLVRAASCLTNLLTATNLSGDAFADRMKSELNALEAPVYANRVVQLVRRQDGFEAVLRDRQIIQARTVCLAAGTRPMPWSLGENLPGVHRDARSLAGELGGAAVAIIGGGEAALDTALSVVRKGGRALILSRSEGLRAAVPLIRRAQNQGVRLRNTTTINKVSGGPGEWMLTTTNGDAIRAAVLVVCIGRTPNDELLDGLGGATPNIPGLWLAGDILRSRDRYVALAMADGQQAALSAYRYLWGEP
jgi:thioredoxin reductase